MNKRWRDNFERKYMLYLVVCVKANMPTSLEYSSTSNKTVKKKISICPEIINPPSQCDHKRACVLPGGRPPKPKDDDFVNPYSSVINHGTRKSILIWNQKKREDAVVSVVRSRQMKLGVGNYCNPRFRVVENKKQEVDPTQIDKRNKNNKKQ